MRKGFIAILIVIIIILVITNPNAEDHQMKIISEGASNLGSSIGGDVGGMFGEFIGSIVGQSINAIDFSLFSYNNYYIFSTMSISGEIITVGVFGQIFFP